MSEWQDIATAPMDGSDVDVWYPTDSGIRIVRCRWHVPVCPDEFPYQAGWVNFDNGGMGIMCNVAPTHWRSCDSKDSPSHKS